MADHVLYQGGASQKVEKPWKPCPPKRSISLGRSDVRVLPLAGRKEKPQTDDVKTIVSIVPIDVSGRSFKKIAQQQKSTIVREVTRNRSYGSTLERNSRTRDNSASDLYGIPEHGFVVKQNLNLREKNLSRDRWTTRTELKLDPYQFDDDVDKASSKNLGLKLEKHAKLKQSGSFLLCASRKSSKLLQSEAMQPYKKKVVSDDNMPLQMSKNSSDLLNKQQRISSEKANRENERECAANEKSRGSGKTKIRHSNSFVASSVSSRPVSKIPTLEKRTSVSEHEMFFSSVAVSNRPPFWSGLKTRNARPVSVPTLADDGMKISGSNSSRSLKSACRDSDFVWLEASKAVPCTLQVISETTENARLSRIPVSLNKSERKMERRNGCSPPSRETENQITDYHSRWQPALMPNSSRKFDQFARSENARLNTLPLDRPEKFNRENLFRGISYSQRLFNEQNFEEFDRTKQEDQESVSYYSDEADHSSFRVASFSKCPDRRSLSLHNQDVASLQSSTTSDWYSARDCTSSSICVDAVGSDVANSSEKGSTTWLTKVRKVFGAVWTVLMPSSFKKQLVLEFDSASDVDSGCSVGCDHDLAALQRSPSEMSELEKLAFLANRVAMDRNRTKTSHDVQFNDHHKIAPFGVPLVDQYQTDSARSVAVGSDGDLQGRSEAEVVGLDQCFRTPSGATRSYSGEKDRFHFSDEVLKSTLPRTKRSAVGFENTHNPLQESFEYFSHGPSVSTLKVRNGCGRMVEQHLNATRGEIDAEDDVLGTRTEKMSLKSVSEHGKTTFQCHNDIEMQKFGVSSCDVSSRDFQLYANVVPGPVRHKPAAVGNGYNSLNRVVSFRDSQTKIFDESPKKMVKRSQSANSYDDFRRHYKPASLRCLEDNTLTESEERQDCSQSEGFGLSCFERVQLSNETSAELPEKLDKSDVRQPEIYEQKSPLREHLALVGQFSVSPELDKAIEMLATFSNCTPLESSAKPLSRGSVSPQRNLTACRPSQGKLSKVETLNGSAGSTELTLETSHRVNMDFLQTHLPNIRENSSDTSGYTASDCSLRAGVKIQGHMETYHPQNFYSVEHSEKSGVHGDEGLAHPLHMPDSSGTLFLDLASEDARRLQKLEPFIAKANKNAAAVSAGKTVKFQTAKTTPGQSSAVSKLNGVREVLPRSQNESDSSWPASKLCRNVTFPSPSVQRTRASKMAFLTGVASK